MKLYALVSILVIAPMHATMNIYEFGAHAFLYDVVPTEYTAYKLLKQKPLPYNVTYVAIPWTWFINKYKMNEIPKNIQVKNGFTICQHTHYKRHIPLFKQMGIKVLFTPHASRTTTYDGITVLPFPHYAVHTADPAPHKDVLYSFVGAQTHFIRKVFFRMKHPHGTIIRRRSGWHFWLPRHKQEQYKKNYIDSLIRSRFAPCLRGVGASTIRFWEALKAGAIPILIADDMALPEEYNWDECIIRVKEKDVKKISHIITHINEEQENNLRQQCLHAYTFFSGKNFVRTIRVYYENLFGNSHE